LAAPDEPWHMADAVLTAADRRVSSS
jgi:hypothetical protein